jgi:hypothetical protein
MPTNKDLKRLVRARMRKTGEAYTAARAHIIKKPKAAAASKPNLATTSVDYAALAGMSDEKVKAKTGCTWERWVRALDGKGAERMSHRDIARLVSEKYKVDGWWSQTVTVGYERIKGLRARGQRRDGHLRSEQVPHVQRAGDDLVRCVGRREDPPAVAEWRERESPDSDSTEIDAPRLD